MIMAREHKIEVRCPTRRKRKSWECRKVPENLPKTATPHEISPILSHNNIFKIAFLVKKAPLFNLEAFLICCFPASVQNFSMGIECEFFSFRATLFVSQMNSLVYVVMRFHIPKIWQIFEAFR